jgi:hypothetical protein
MTSNSKKTILSESQIFLIIFELVEDIINLFQLEYFN